MPKLNAPQTQRLVLPSTADEPNEVDRAWIDIRSKVLVGDLGVARQEPDDFTRGFKLICRMITDWNFTDEAGNLLPVTEENVNHLDKIDYEFIDEWLGEQLEKQEAGYTDSQKKTSSSTSIPVLTEDTPADPPPTNT